jgi:hypothetical protein
MKTQKMKLPQDLPRQLRSRLERGDRIDVAYVGGTINDIEEDHKVTRSEMEHLKMIGQLPTAAFYHSSLGGGPKDKHPKKLAALVARDAERTLDLKVSVKTNISGVSFSIGKNIDVVDLESQGKEDGSRTEWGNPWHATVYARHISADFGNGETTRFGGTAELRIGNERFTVDLEPGEKKSKLIELFGKALERRKIGREWFGEGLLVYAPQKSK